MKVQHFLSGATLLSAALLLNAPLSAAVESDVVGYTTVELTASYTLLGTNFSGINANADDAIPISDVFEADLSNGDQLQIRNAGGGYDIYEWYDGNWCRYNSHGEVILSPTVNRGVAFWIFSRTASSEAPIKAHLKGSVKLADALSMSFGAQYSMVSSGFPVEMEVNSPSFSWQNLNEADMLQIPNGIGGYTILEWRNNQWCRYHTSDRSDATIPQYSGVWVVSTNPNASVTVNIQGE